MKFGHKRENKMAHPYGGDGNTFSTKNNFAQAFRYVGPHGVSFRSTTGEQIFARHGKTRDGNTDTIVFMGERNRHGSVCEACWGYRIDCNGSRIGQCAEALDDVIT